MAAAFSVIQLGLLNMQPLQLWLKGLAPIYAWCTGRHTLNVTHGWVKALVPWQSPHFYQNGVMLGSVFRRKVVMTDASKMGWGTMCEGRITFG